MYCTELHIVSDNPVEEMIAWGADYCIVLCEMMASNDYLVEVWTYELPTMRAIIEEYYEDEPGEVDFFMENYIVEGEINVTEHE